MKGLAPGTARNRRRRLYRAAIWFLLFAQVQLIFAAELHQHGYPFFSSGQPGHISATHQKSRGSAPGGSVCVVCQIVRQSAARPSTSGPSVHLSGSVAFHAPVVETRASSLSLVILPVRAPPSPEWF